MKYLVVALLLLTGCERVLPGRWNLVKCSNGGCGREFTFNNQVECENMARQLKSKNFAYQCMVVK